jgi:hypothetical protein
MRADVIKKNLVQIILPNNAQIHATKTFKTQNIGTTISLSLIVLAGTLLFQISGF